MCVCACVYLCMHICMCVYSENIDRVSLFLVFKASVCKHQMKTKTINDNKIPLTQTVQLTSRVCILASLLVQRTFLTQIVKF